MENDDKKQDETKVNSEKHVLRLAAQKALRQLNNEGSPWTLTQELLQEIQATHIVLDPDKLPHVTEMIEELKKEIETRYAEDAELKKILFDSIPAASYVRKWLKKEGWEEAVWKKIRGNSLFSPEKRAQVIESLRKRAVDSKRPSDTAAKIWLTLSGDYSEKMEVTDKSLDAYREINSILHKKKSSE